MNFNAPGWKLDSVYASFDCAEYKRDCELLKERIADFEALLAALPQDVTAEHLVELIKGWEAAGDYAQNLASYAEAVYTTDTRNRRAQAEINNIEAIKLPLGKDTVIFRGALATRRERVLALARTDSRVKPYAFFLSEAIEKASYQMKSELEDLANDLCRSGGGAWARLHDALSSTAGAVMDRGGGWKTVTELRTLANSGDRDLRRSAYFAELEAWKAVEIPMAAALNGVKGHAITVDKRRGWKTQLQKSAFQSRISEKTLSSLISAIETALPLFRRYLNRKAKLLGLEKCAFFDLFAPVNTDSSAVKRWTWDEASAFTADCFEKFDPAMADFVRQAYSKGWVDAEMRNGKIGGAYCTDFPLAKEARVFCNFEGTFASVTTIAHETGHAWHHELIKNLPRSLSIYPMTLAETASLFAETLVFEESLGTAAASERLALIESSVKDSCQTLVDILSRYYFETELFERREKKELSPEELCAMMLNAQKKTYGDAVDAEKLHPYMWAAKVHYYSPVLPFYNYPYAFGHLFALALYAHGGKAPSFSGTYRRLLEETGRCSAEDLARKAGFDISGGDFWQEGIGVIEKRIEQLEAACK